MGYWLVGDAPPNETADRPDAHLTPDETGLPTIGNMLLEMTEWTLEQFLSVFEVRCTVWKRQWPMWLADGRAGAAKIAHDSLEDEATGVVLVGNRTAEAFGFGYDELFEWRGRFAVIPSPQKTRLARYWKQDGLRESARSFFSGILAVHRRRRAALAGRGSRRSNR